MEYSEGGEFGKVASTKSSRSSWDVFKKLAIAGASIASVPFVVPLALLCLALSFPFALLFAGFACANKAMMYLFPLPPQVPRHEKQLEEEAAEEEEEEEEVGDEDEGDEKGRIEIERDGKKREEPVEGETLGAAVEEERREEKEGEGEKSSKTKKGKSKKATSKKSTG